MKSQLDHIVVTTPQLEAGVTWVETALGQTMAGGGDHVAMGTHNRLMSLGPDEYLEVIAANPSATPPGRPRFFDLDTPRDAPRLTNWVLRVDDLNAALAVAPDGMGKGVALSRGAYSWRMAVPADGRLPFDGLFPSLIQWEGAHPGPDIPDAGVRLRKLILTTPDPDAYRAAIAPFIRGSKLEDLLTLSGGAPGLAAQIDTPDGPCALNGDCDKLRL